MSLPLPLDRTTSITNAIFSEPNVDLYEAAADQLIISEELERAWEHGISMQTMMQSTQNQNGLNGGNNNTGNSTSSRSIGGNLITNSLSSVLSQAVNGLGGGGLSRSLGLRFRRDSSTNNNNQNIIMGQGTGHGDQQQLQSKDNTNASQSISTTTLNQQQQQQIQVSGTMQLVLQMQQLQTATAIPIGHQLSVVDETIAKDTNIGPAFTCDSQELGQNHDVSQNGDSENHKKIILINNEDSDESKANNNPSTAQQQQNQIHISPQSQRLSNVSALSTVKSHLSENPLNIAGSFQVAPYRRRLTIWQMLSYCHLRLVLSAGDITLRPARLLVYVEALKMSPSNIAMAISALKSLDLVLGFLIAKCSDDAQFEAHKKEQIRRASLLAIGANSSSGSGTNKAGVTVAQSKSQNRWNEVHDSSANKFKLVPGSGFSCFGIYVFKRFINWFTSWMSYFKETLTDLSRRHGRRKPFICVGMPLSGISMVMFCSPGIIFEMQNSVVERTCSQLVQIKSDGSGGAGTVASSCDTSLRSCLENAFTNGLLPYWYQLDLTEYEENEHSFNGNNAHISITNSNPSDPTTTAPVSPYFQPLLNSEESSSSISQLSLLLYFIPLYFLYYVSTWTITMVQYDSLGFELTDSEKERSDFFGLKALATFFGYIAAIALQAWLASSVTEAVPEQYSIMSIVFAIWGIVAMINLVSVIAERPFIPIQALQIFSERTSRSLGMNGVIGPSGTGMQHLNHNDQVTGQLSNVQNQNQIAKKKNIQEYIDAEDSQDSAQANETYLKGNPTLLTTQAVQNNTGSKNLNTNLNNGPEKNNDTNTQNSEQQMQVTFRLTDSGTITQTQSQGQEFLDANDDEESDSPGLVVGHLATENVERKLTELDKQFTASGRFSGITYNQQGLNTTNQNQNLSSGSTADGNSNFVNNFQTKLAGRTTKSYQKDSNNNVSSQQGPQTLLQQHVDNNFNSAKPNDIIRDQLTNVTGSQGISDIEHINTTHTDRNSVITNPDGRLANQEQIQLSSMNKTFSVVSTATTATCQQYELQEAKKNLLSVATAIPLVPSARRVLRNPAYKIYLLFRSPMSMVGLMPTNLLSFVSKYAIQKENYMPFLLKYMFTSTLGAVVLVPIYVKISQYHMLGIRIDRLGLDWRFKSRGKKTVLIFVLGANAILLTTMGFLTPDVIGFALWEPMFLFTLFMYGGSLSTFFALPDSILNDVVDYDELVSGGRNEGFFAILETNLQQYLEILGGVLPLLMLGYYGFEPNKGCICGCGVDCKTIGMQYARWHCPYDIAYTCDGSMSSEILFGDKERQAPCSTDLDAQQLFIIKFFSGILPGILAFISMIFVMKMPITEKIHKKIVMQISLRERNAYQKCYDPLRHNALIILPTNSPKEILRDTMSSGEIRVGRKILEHHLRQILEKQDKEALPLSQGQNGSKVQTVQGSQLQQQNETDESDHGIVSAPEIIASDTDDMGSKNGISDVNAEGTGNSTVNKARDSTVTVVFDDEKLGQQQQEPQTLTVAQQQTVPSNYTMTAATTVSHNYISTVTQNNRLSTTSSSTNRGSNYSANINNQKGNNSNIPSNSGRSASGSNSKSGKDSESDSNFHKSDVSAAGSNVNADEIIKKHHHRLVASTGSSTAHSSTDGNTNLSRNQNLSLLSRGKAIISNLISNTRTVLTSNHNVLISTNSDIEVNFNTNPFTTSTHPAVIEAKSKILQIIKFKLGCCYLVLFLITLLIILTQGGQGPVVFGCMGYTILFIATPWQYMKWQAVRDSGDRIFRDSLVLGVSDRSRNGIFM